jgi:hypothetical protein
MSKHLTLAVTPSIKLRPSQADLYAFIVGKHKTGGTITLAEVVEQYSTYGNRNILNGKPCYYRHDWEEHTSRLEPLTGDELRLWAVQWFIRNLGIFVVKGLLTAVPTMELSQIQLDTAPDLAEELPTEALASPTQAGCKTAVEP